MASGKTPVWNQNFSLYVLFDLQELSIWVLKQESI